MSLFGKSLIQKLEEARLAEHPESFPTPKLQPITVTSEFFKQLNEQMAYIENIKKETQ